MTTRLGLFPKTSERAGIRPRPSRCPTVSSWESWTTRQGTSLLLPRNGRRVARFSNAICPRILKHLERICRVSVRESSVFILDSPSVSSRRVSLSNGNQQISSRDQSQHLAAIDHGEVSDLLGDERDPGYQQDPSLRPHSGWDSSATLAESIQQSSVLVVRTGRFLSACGQESGWPQRTALHS